jgi:hypothetical protein
MAAATKSLDTDFLSLRTVFEKNVINQNVSSTKVLASDGQNGTFWSPAQALGGLPTFNAFETSVGKYTATETNRTLRLSAGDGFSMDGYTLNAASLTCIDVSGSTSISSSKLKIATTGFLSATTDIKTNTITLYSSKAAPALSTGDLYFQQLKVISSVQAPLDTRPFGGNALFSGRSYDFYTTFAGVGSLTLSSFTTTKQVFLSMYPYTAAGFLQMSTTVGSLFISTMSTISSVYITKPDFSTGMGSVSTLEFLNHSTNVSTLVELSNYSQIRYLNAVGETLARAFIVQLTDQFGILNSGLSTLSSVKTTRSLMLATNASIIANTGIKVTSTISTFTDFGSGTTYDARITKLYLFSTQLSTLSTSLGSNVTLMSNVARAGNTSYIISTNSTISHLGSIGYVSSQSLVSTVRSLPYISSQAFQSTAVSLSYISSVALVSTFSLSNQLGKYTDRSTFTQNLQSTVKQVNENAPYISTLTLQSSLQSTVTGIPFVLGNYIQTANLVSTTQGIINYASFNGYVSSLSSFAISGYVSSKTLDYSLYSTTNAIFSRTSVISTASLTSTVNGLGQIYLSSIKLSSFGLTTTSSIAYSGNRSADYLSYFVPTYGSNPNSTGVFDPGTDSYFYPNINPYDYYAESAYGTYYTYTDIFLKTAELDISAFSNYIKATSRVQIDFNLSIFINPPADPQYFQSPVATQRLLPMGSYLTYTIGDSTYTIQEARFTEHAYCYLDTPSIKVTKRISFTILGQYLTPVLSRTISLRHRIENYTYSSSGNDGVDGQYLVFPSPQNSIFVSIYN